MASSRSERYERKDKNDDLSSLSERLAADLRKSIQALALHPVLTPAWLETAETFARIGRVSEMEAKLPKSTETATLWECEEVALRYILEDGKLNLCLRILVQYKASERDMIEKGTYSELSSANRESMDKLEVGLGIMMKNAWHHSEAIQITDLHVLLHHVADVLEFALEHPDRVKELTAGDRPQFRQEFLVLHYMYSVMTQLDDNNESRIASCVKSRGILGLVAKFLHQYHSAMGEEDVLFAAKALALICDSEDYRTFPDSYMTGPGSASALLDLRKEQDLLPTLTKTSLDNRKALRPLLDAIRDLDHDPPNDSSSSHK